MNISEKKIHELFEVSIILKGVHAALELIGGLFLMFVSTSVITGWVVRLTQKELIEQPNDVITNYFLQMTHHLSVSGKSFAAFYLLSHGIIKLFLVAALLRDKVWAYPASLVVLGLFIFYQIYRFTFTHSVWLIALSVFDVFIVWLVWHEYSLIRRHLSRG